MKLEQQLPERSDEEDVAELYPAVNYNEAAEARVRRKLDLNLMPLFFVLCTYDRKPDPLLRFLHLNADGILSKISLHFWTVAILVMRLLQEWKRTFT